MSVFTGFEAKVFDLLAAGVLTPEQKQAVLREARQVSYDYTGSGYFLTVAHPILPAERTVCNDPIVMGHAGSLDCGFVLFLERGEAMLECHTWGEVDLPADFRSRDVEIEIRTDVIKIAREGKGSPTSPPSQPR